MESKVGAEWRDVFSVRVTNRMVQDFAFTTLDLNPVHVREDAASNSLFGKRVAHGRLTGSLAISAILGLGIADMPILLESHDKYIAPVFLEDRLKYSLRISNIRESDRGRIFVFFYWAVNSRDERVIEGSFTILVPAASQL